MPSYTAVYLDESGAVTASEEFRAADDTHAVRMVLWSEVLLDAAGWTLHEGGREVTPTDEDYDWSPPTNYNWDGF